MTDKELAKEAFEYRKELVPYTELGYPDVGIPVYEALDIDRAYVAGAKENGVIWHDLRKNPDDLPKNQNEVLCLLWEDSYYIGYYHINSKMWCFDEFSLSEDENKDEVTAWCEIPKFEVEE